MKAIVTRPAAQAGAWVARLAARGIEAEALPLIAIGEPADPQAVVAAWHALGEAALAVFVSPSAVERFFARRPPALPWPAATRAAAVGPGTAAALREAGVPAAAIVAPAADAAQFDSEALWARLGTEPWAGCRVRLVRGDGGRDWLAERLREAGATVEPLQAYRREAPRPDAAQRALLARALHAPRAHAWLFGSAEAIEHLDALAPGQDWSASIAVATHPRIAARARRLGIRRVLESAPGFDAVVGCIESLRSAATP